MSSSAVSHQLPCLVNTRTNLLGTHGSLDACSTMGAGKKRKKNILIIRAQDHEPLKSRINRSVAWIVNFNILKFSSPFRPLKKLWRNSNNASRRVQGARQCWTGGRNHACQWRHSALYFKPIYPLNIESYQIRLRKEDSMTFGGTEAKREDASLQPSGAI